jgi:glycosyltransferase involved in cell wall biosynthesis
MRIAILIHAQSPFGYQYGRIFQQRGHQVELLSPSDCDAPEQGVPVKYVGPAGFKPWLSKSRLMPYLKTIAPLRRALREFKPDILLANYLSSGGLLACLSGHKRIVVSAIGSDVVAGIRSPLWRRLFRWQFRKARFVHVVAPQLAQLLYDKCGLDPHRTVIAPIGVDTNLLAMAEASSRPGAGAIVCTRAHRPVYGQETLVKAMATLKQRGVACSLLFTHTMDVQTTRELVRRHGVEDMVTFRPGYKYEELPGILAGADVYVSASFSDGMSNSLLEAMSTGTFPVVSDIPANRPWIEHGRTGLLFPPGDEHALADRLIEALGNPALRSAAAELNRKKVVEQGDMYHEADRLLDAFARLLADEKHA